LTLPAHYQRFARTHLRFALVMVFVGLLTGVLFQESAKKVHPGPAVPVGAHLEYVLGLALVHGHTFLMGVLLPLALTWILHLGLALGHPPVAARTLKVATGLYLPAAAAALALMLLKGYHFVLGIRHGLDFPLLSQTFLGGGHGLRAAVYGTVHTALAAGLGLFAVAVWRSLGSARSDATTL